MLLVEMVLGLPSRYRHLVCQDKVYKTKVYQPPLFLQRGCPHPVVLFQLSQFLEIVRIGLCVIFRNKDLRRVGP